MSHITNHENCKLLSSLDEILCDRHLFSVWKFCFNDCQGQGVTDETTVGLDHNTYSLEHENNSSCFESNNLSIK